MVDKYANKVDKMRFLLKSAHFHSFLGEFLSTSSFFST